MEEYPLAVEHLGLEIHPETPPTGVDLNKRYGEDRLQILHKRLRRMGEPYGIDFMGPQWMPNSHHALEAAEYARHEGLHRVYHHALMKAYFTELKDISDIEVLKNLASASGLDPEDLESAVLSRRFEYRLMADAAEAQQNGIQNTPTYVIDGELIIVGAQSIERFREVLDRRLRLE